MPIYEYRCQQGHTFEVMQRMTDDAVSSCQTCSAPVERVFHPVAIHFKGKGFYNTDYGTRKRSRELKDAAEGGSSKSDGDSASSSSSDSGSSTSETKSGSDSSEKSSTKTSESKSSTSSTPASSGKSSKSE